MKPSRIDLRTRDLREKCDIASGKKPRSASLSIDSAPRNARDHVSLQMQSPQLPTQEEGDQSQVQEVANPQRRHQARTESPQVLEKTPSSPRRGADESENAPKKREADREAMLMCK
jgi:phosphatidate phosphatase APP1